MVWDGVTWFMKHSFDTIWLCINQRYCKQTIRQGCLFQLKLSYFPTEFSSNPAPIQMFVIILKSSWRSWFSGSQVGFTFTHLADFYPKRLTVHSGYIFFCQYVCSLGIEPTTFVLLMQCSTTEPQEQGCDGEDIFPLVNRRVVPVSPGGGLFEFSLFSSLSFGFK